MNTLDKQYTDLLQDILDNGVTKQTRNGGTLSVFGRQIRHSMKDGFPLLTTKKLHWRSIVTELLWFLQGRTDLRWLLEQGNTIWVGDCYANYLKKRDRFSNKDNVKEDVVINGMNGSSNRPLTQEEFINKIKTDDEFAKKWGELGPVYGKQWRDWGSKRVSKRFYDKKIPYSKFVQEGGIDQITNLINDLKTNPDSRRLMVNAWNVGELDEMVLPPCHFSWQVYTRELSLEERELYAITKYPKLNEEPLGALVDRQSFSHDFGDSLNIPTRAISLMFNMRSCDTFLGLPFNIASYGLLLEIIAKEVNMVPDELIGNLGDVHLYSNHIEQAKEQIGREPYPLPKLLFKDHLKSFDTIIDILRVQDFILDNYQSHPSIKAELSN
jgi:thymidylate synthase